MDDKLFVRKIENGIVIDHIPAGKALLVLKILNLEPDTRTAIAMNVDSSKTQKKDMIKVEGRFLTSKEIDLLSLVAPDATINRIEEWRVKEKHAVKISDYIGTLKCRNPECSSRRFAVIKSSDVKKTAFRCASCGTTIFYNEAINYILNINPIVSREKINRRLLDVLLRKGALRISEKPDNLFVFKSGRKSPNFINLGALTDGESLASLKWAFASYISLLLEEKKIEDFDFVFGPAYKGINLAVLACEGLNELYGMQKRYLYDRIEEKDYGDKAADKVIVGAGYFKPGSRILIVDDVITTGGTKLEAIDKLKLLGSHKVAGLVLAVDRQERMGDAVNVESHSATESIEKQGIPVFSILNMQDIFSLVKDSLPDDIKQLWVEYYYKYGAVKLR